MFKFKYLVASACVLLSASAFACEGCAGQRTISVLCFTDNPPAFCKNRPQTEEATNLADASKEQPATTATEQTEPPAPPPPPLPPPAPEKKSKPAAAKK
ncbi:type IV secretory pathway VirB10-like protein [Chitinivorax tropicus]|uniref:Type IV secretory pathway VirB10-like protein n=1 Tax=Chitinivorax tropicus TaxID=714531 RepID=A0A840MJL7_9PROT|nr:hypothetical protein [Chitinivorax tropicus]MBB5016882.1 type IV secretory pathway VirB10-like protein [Chitinivorax tropicus]